MTAPSQSSPAFKVLPLPIRQTPEQRRRAERVMQLTRGMRPGQRLKIVSELLLINRSLEATEWNVMCEESVQ
jgi:hypothetical protein